MALSTKAALENEDFRRISGEDYYTLRATNKNDEELLIQNHHYMISSYRTNKYLDDTIFSGKTGYTSDALNTLVTCGKRNDMDVIVVTMRTQSTGERGVPLFTDTTALLDYANNFQRFNISDNETTFVVDNAYDFSVDTEDFKNSGSLISIDKDSCVILPNAVSFQDAVPSITFEEQNGNSKAYLTYEFAGQIVGKASITLDENTEEEFSFSETESTGELTGQNGPKFITINVTLILAILLGLAALVLIIYSIYRLYLKNRAKIRKSINIYQKRRFLKRRRYHRRKKRR
jgi:D-alanyl-D-alanine carboxypeptidase (penicillin-binding protein 5/6)